MKTPFVCPSWTCAYAYTLLLLFSFQCITAQSINWEYVVETNSPTEAGISYFNADGHTFLNVMTEDPERDGFFNQLAFVTQINAEGEKIRDIDVDKNTTEKLMPINDDSFVNNNFNWGFAEMKSNTNSQFKPTGSADQAFKSTFHSYTSSVESENGISFFKNASDFNAYTMTWGTINNQFESTVQSLDLEGIRKEGLGITNNNIAPVQLENGTWVIPVQYGIMKESALSIDHGALVAMRDNELLWNFPKHLDEYNIQGICALGNTIGLLERPSHCGDHHIFKQLDNEGNTLNSIRINRKDIFKHVQMNASQLIISTRNEIFVYDHDGNFQFGLNSDDLNISRIQNMTIHNGNLIVAATRNNNALVMSVHLGMEEITMEESANEDTATDINTTTEVVHSVYPNPASEYTNIKVENFTSERKIKLIIYNMTGQLIHQENIRNEITRVNLTDINSGQYIYNLIETQDLNETMSVGKFLKVSE